MPAGESIGTEQFAGLTLGDAARWTFALLVVAALGAGALVWTPDWTAPAGDASLPEPAILLELAPVPEPEPEQPAPALEPEPVPPVVQPDPPPPEPVEEAAAEPEPLPVPASVEPEIPEPEPVAEPEPVPEPVPEPEAEAPVVAFPLPATMSAALQQQRLQTPPTPRPPRQPPRQTPPEQPAAAPSPPPAAAAGPTPEQWQQEVLRYLDRRKVYPREAQRAGQEGVVRISFTIDSAGRVLSVGIAGSSGIPALDQAALDTARRASPVPRPPAAMGQGSLSLTASIRFTLR